MPVPVVSHDQKSHVSAHFNHLKQRNTYMYIDRQTESLFRFPGRQSRLTLYDRFTQKMIEKRPFINDTGEDSAVHIHCSGLLRDRAYTRRQSICWEDELYVVSRVAVKRWSCKGQLLVTLKKQLCTFIIRSPKRQSSSGLCSSFP